MFKLLVFWRKEHNLLLQNKAKLPSLSENEHFSFEPSNGRGPWEWTSGCRWHLWSGGGALALSLPSGPQGHSLSLLAGSCTSPGPYYRGPHPPHPNLFFGNFFLFEKERDLHVPECHCRIRGSRLLMLPFLNNSESLQAWARHVLFWKECLASKCTFMFGETVHGPGGGRKCQDFLSRIKCFFFFFGWKVLVLKNLPRQET